MSEPQFDRPRLLQVSGVTKSFRGLVALRNVSIHVEAGEILGVIGPNGAGKTTLFNSVAGTFRVDSGRIDFAGRDITRLAPHRRARRGIGRTFQLVKPFGSLSVLDNAVVAATATGLSKKAAREHAEQVLDRLGLHKQMSQVAGTLNAVEGKRLEVARALATRPKVVLLDEIFAGLNEEEVADLAALVRGLPSDDITVLLIEHNVGAIRTVADRVVALTAGEVIAEGSPAEVFSDVRVVESYLGKRGSDA